jgi:hypothetical protein
MGGPLFFLVQFVAYLWRCLEGAMASYTYPKILKDHYAAMRALVSDLPATFEQWELAVQKKKNKDRYECEAAEPESFSSHDVIINGGLFKAWCDKKGETTPTISLLFEYAFSLSKS